MRGLAREMREMFSAAKRAGSNRRGCRARGDSARKEEAPCEGKRRVAREHRYPGIASGERRRGMAGAEAWRGRGNWRWQNGEQWRNRSAGRDGAGVRWRQNGKSRGVGGEEFAQQCFGFFVDGIATGAAGNARLPLVKTAAGDRPQIVGIDLVELRTAHAKFGGGLRSRHVAGSERGEDVAHQRCWKTGQELTIRFFTREIKSPPPCGVAPIRPPTL